MNMEEIQSQLDSVQAQYDAASLEKRKQEDTMQQLIGQFNLLTKQKEQLNARSSQDGSTTAKQASSKRTGK